MIHSRFAVPGGVAAEAIHSMGSIHYPHSPGHDKWALRVSVTTRMGRLAHITITTSLLLAGLTACAAAPIPPAVSTEAPPAARTLHVVSHGWHTGIVLRAADVPTDAWPARGDFPGAQYLEIGWGNRDYYQAADPGAWLALKAAFWPTPGVLHVLAFNGAVKGYFGAAGPFLHLPFEVSGSRLMARASRLSLTTSLLGAAVLHSSAVHLSGGIVIR
jgi:hypothetical protein